MIEGAMERALAVVEKTAFSQERYTPQGFTKAIAEAIDEAVQDALERAKPVADESELCLREVMQDLDVLGMTQRRFPGVHPMESWFGRFTIIPHFPGQLSLMVLIVDATFCEAGQFDVGKEEREQPWQFWTTNTAFDRREMQIAGSRVAELIVRRLASAFEHWRQTYIGAIDQVALYDVFEDLTIPWGRTMPTIVEDNP